MSMDIQELKPCPFCGSIPEIETRNVEPQGDSWYGRKDETFVLCKCGACLFDGSFHDGFGTSPEGETNAVVAWNRRAAPPAGEMPALDERAAFEKWAFENSLMQESHGLRAIDSHCDTAWKAWQARSQHAAQQAGADAVDAARYRAIRRVYGLRHGSYATISIVINSRIHQPNLRLEGWEADTAIDAALAASKEKKE